MANRTPEALHEEQQSIPHVVSTAAPQSSRSSAAAATKVAAEQLTAGARQQGGHVDRLPRAAKSCQELENCVFKLEFQKGR